MTIMLPVFSFRSSGLMEAVCYDRRKVISVASVAASTNVRNSCFPGLTAKMRSLKRNLLLFPLFPLILAHGDHNHEQISLAADSDWATRHMAGSRLSQHPSHHRS